MNLAGRVKFLTFALVAASLGGNAEARSHHPAASHGHSEFRGHTEMVSRHGGGFHGTSHQAFWQTYGRGNRLAFRGHSGRFARHTGYSSGGGIQCVTFARSDSGIELSGNANTWWDHAAGIYQRGSRPEPGSVLNFRANGSMRMGHVAVVNQVVDGRTVIIDHANWGGPGAVRGGVSRDISVVDVSPANDWSAVRVALGHSGDYGSIYPTYGFIYNRPDPGTMVATADTGAAIPELNPAPRDLRGSVRDQAFDEVAEAPDSPVLLGPHHSYRRHHGSVSAGRHLVRRHHH
jgi:surface antigen